MHNSLVRELVQAGRRTSCLGLTNGKMGIVIALFHYGRLYGEQSCEEIAGELLDEVCEHLDYSMPISFGDGLCGDRKSTRLNSSHIQKSRMPSSA